MTVTTKANQVGRIGFMLLLTLTACTLVPQTILRETVSPTVVRPLPTMTTMVTPTITPTPLATPQPIEAAVETVTRALQSNDATVLAPLLLDQVLLARGPDGSIGGMIKSEDAIAWLTARWGKQRSVTAREYVEHFVMLEITTQGWANVAPLEQGRIIFHLHRYNAHEQEDALNGQWRIDAILYQ